MRADRVSNPELLTNESGVLPTALRGPAGFLSCINSNLSLFSLLSPSLWKRIVIDVD